MDEKIEEFVISDVVLYQLLEPLNKISSITILSTREKLMLYIRTCFIYKINRNVLVIAIFSYVDLQISNQVVQFLQFQSSIQTSLFHF